MDFKKEAARIAFTLIRNNSVVGLGDGSTIRFLAEYIIDEIKKGLTLRLYTSSRQTQIFLQEGGITVNDFSLTDELDQYFDGCDQVDSQLNAFKSGAGIHTTEKILASMAKKFILLAEDSKFVDTLENKYPLVLEVIPQAGFFVKRKMKSMFPDTILSTRITEDNKTPVTTRYGNYLIDCRFPVLPELELLQNNCKNITGVVDISLFYKLAHGAVIVGNQGVRRFERKNNLVTMIAVDPG
jgi:ribose 5-phosphate isomerase A